MRLKLYISVLMLCVYALANAQQSGVDQELTSLIDVVKTLRASNEAAFNNAMKVLEKDTKWTPMDETGSVRDGVECKASENVPRFKLNKILSRVNGNRKYVSTHGDMVNGEDTRYDYSLYERSLKSGAEVKYSLKGREGRQVFVIVPFDSNARFSAKVESGGKTVSGKLNPDGTVVVAWDKDLPTRNTEFVLSVKNETKSSQSMVIINHNTRVK